MSTDDHLALVADIRRAVGDRFLEPLGRLLPSVSTELVDITRTVDIHAEAWAAQLLNGGDRIARETALQLMSTLFDGEPPRSWWSTPLGRAVAANVGHPTCVTVPPVVAAAMLGITRQGVADLIKRGKLSTHPDGGISSASIADRLSASTPSRRSLV